MSLWTPARVAELLGAPDTGGAAFTAVSTDTRQLRGGELFVALRGERFDAHQFLDEARARGATGAVVRRGTAAVDGLRLFPVDDTLTALGTLARARRRALPATAPVIAVTGSTGKTSAKELLRAALAARYRVHATTGNLNNRVGVPLTLLATPAEAEAVVVEAGASLPGEIATLRKIIEPTIGVVTTVGYAHVEGFGTLAGVLEEKVSLLEGAPVAVVGIEPPALAAAARARAARVVVAGRGGAPTTVHPDAVDLDDLGRPRITWGGASVTLAASGMHQVDNAMIALAAAREAGVAPAVAVPALGAATLPAGRAAVRRVAGWLVVDDTYNANPASLRASLELARWLASRHGRPLAVVVGSMLELGPESDRLHAEAARQVAAAGPVIVAAVGAFVPAFAAMGGGLAARLLTGADAEQIGPVLRETLRGDEVLLLKASRGVALERVLRHLT